VILDSSALLAVLLAEPNAERILAHIEGASSPKVGAPTVVESAIVLTSRVGLAGKTLLARLLHEGGIEVVPFDEVHWSVAVDAFARYGKGRHPAALNFGDCLTYAVAKLSGQPLLCLGDDFTRTDLPLVLTAG
jgi:ribonuclease VapC